MENEKNVHDKIEKTLPLSHLKMWGYREKVKDYPPPSLRSVSIPKPISKALAKLAREFCSFFSRQNPRCAKISIIPSPPKPLLQTFDF